MLVLAAAAAIFLWRSQPAAPLNYLTSPAEIGDMTIEVSATGTLQPLIQVSISSELSGIVRSVSADENQRVKKGDVLAELDTAKLRVQIERAQASVEVAEAQVASAKTSLDEAKRALDRAEQLSSRGMVAEEARETAEFARDRADSALANAQATLAIAKADLKSEQTDLEKSTIYAPIDGMVLTRSVDPGQTVASSLQAPVLFVIAADLTHMELKAAIDEADIGSVHPGQQGRFTVDAFSDRRFTAKIRDISYASVTTEGVVTYNAELDVDNAELLLRPGMTATVNVVAREAKGVLTVPAAAFRYKPPTEPRRGGGFSLARLFAPRIGRPDRQKSVETAADGTRAVYLLRNGHPVETRVKAGATDGERVEILSGLNAGDPVITGVAERAE